MAISELNLTANQKSLVFGEMLDEVQCGTNELLELSQTEFDKLSLNGSMILSITESFSESLRSLHSKTDTPAQETRQLLGTIDAKLTRLLEGDLGGTSKMNPTAGSDMRQDVNNSTVKTSSLTLHSRKSKSIMEHANNLGNLEEEHSWGSHDHLSVPIHRIVENLGRFTTKVFSSVLAEYISLICAWTILRAHERRLLAPIKLAPKHVLHASPKNDKIALGWRIGHLRRMFELDNEMSMLEEVERMLEVDEPVLQRCADAEESTQYREKGKLKPEGARRGTRLTKRTKDVKHHWYQPVVVVKPSMHTGRSETTSRDPA